MSSGFVSGGTSDQPIERDDEWLRAQQEIEETRRRNQEEGRQTGGKSLYEVLQANKDAKQEAFEESIRLKNQFRNLDEDEVEFLDSVLESTRAKEEAVKRETKEQLDVFRRQQEEADKALLIETGNNTESGSAIAASPPSEGGQWALNARKRKRAKEKEVLKGVKLRKSSSTSETPLALHMDDRLLHTEDRRRLSTSDAKGENDASSDIPDGHSRLRNHASPGPGMNVSSTSEKSESATAKSTAHIAHVSKASPAVLPGLGLGDYSSDEE